MIELLTGPSAATIAAWVTAIAAIVAVAIYYLTFRSVNDQARIASEQFRLISAEFAERYRPALSVLLKYNPGITKDDRPSIKITIENHGRAEVRVTAIEMRDRQMVEPILKDSSLLIPSGGRQAATGQIQWVTICPPF